MSMEWMVFLSLCGTHASRVCTPTFVCAKMCMRTCAEPQPDRTSADWWKHVCFNEHPKWIHPERDLLSRFMLLLLLSDDMWSMRHQSAACVFVYLWCARVFFWSMCDVPAFSVWRCSWHSRGRTAWQCREECVLECYMQFVKRLTSINLIKW